MILDNKHAVVNPKAIVIKIVIFVKPSSKLKRSGREMAWNKIIKAMVAGLNGINVISAWCNLFLTFLYLNRLIKDILLNISSRIAAPNFIN